MFSVGWWVIEIYSGVVTGKFRGLSAADRFWEVVVGYANAGRGPGFPFP